MKTLFQRASIFVLVLSFSHGPVIASDGIDGILVTLKADDLVVVQAGEKVYHAQCAACHGAELEGQPDWRRRLENGRMPAPPHDETGHTWHHSDRNLFIVTKGGVQALVPGYESDMPAFEGVLTDDEIADVVAYIKSTWPERQREFQAEVSANDKGEL